MTRGSSNHCVRLIFICDNKHLELPSNRTRHQKQSRSTLCWAYQDEISRRDFVIVTTDIFLESVVYSVQHPDKDSRVGWTGKSEDCHRQVLESLVLLLRERVRSANCTVLGQGASLCSSWSLKHHRLYTLSQSLTNIHQTRIRAHTHKHTRSHTHIHASTHARTAHAHITHNILQRNQHKRYRYGNNSIISHCQSVNLLSESLHQRGSKLNQTQLACPRVYARAVRREREVPPPVARHTTTSLPARRPSIASR